MRDPVTGRADVHSRLERVKAEIFALGVHRLALFGSLQRNEARADSDVDVLVEFMSGRKSYRSLCALGDLLEHELGRPVELVSPDWLSPYIGPHILAEAEDVIIAA